MQAGVKAPRRDHRGVVARRVRGWQVPEAEVPRWSDLHDRGEGTEGQPARVHVGIHRLLVVTAGVGTPVGVAHHRGTLDRDDGSAEALRGAADVAAPEDGGGRTAGVGAAGHRDEVVAAVLARDFGHGLGVIGHESIAVLADGFSVEALHVAGRGGVALRDVLFAAVELEAGDAHLEELLDSRLPVGLGGRVGQIHHRVVVGDAARRGRLGLAGEGVALVQRLLDHLTLEEGPDPEDGLHVLALQPFYLGLKVGQPPRIDFEVIVAERARPPGTVDPVDAVGDAVGAHHQDVLDDLGVEGRRDRRAIVVGQTVGVLVAPAPRPVHPFRRNDGGAGVECMRLDQLRGGGGGVDLEAKGGTFERDADAGRVRRGKVIGARPVGLDEEAVALRRKVERRVDRGGRLHEHLHLLPAQVHGLGDAGCPGGLLRAVHDPLHQAGVILVGRGLDGEAPLDDACSRGGGQVDAMIVAPVRLHGEGHGAPVGHPGLGDETVAARGEAEVAGQRGAPLRGLVEDAVKAHGAGHTGEVEHGPASGVLERGGRRRGRDGGAAGEGGEGEEAGPKTGAGDFHGFQDLGLGKKGEGSGTRFSARHGRRRRPRSFRPPCAWPSRCRRASWRRARRGRRRTRRPSGRR